MLLSANTLFFFTYQIIDDAFCYTTQLPGLYRDPNKQLRYFQFIEYFYHALELTSQRLKESRFKREDIACCDA